MNDEQKKERTKENWYKARIIADKIRFKTRLKKMAETNNKQLVNDDAFDEEEDLDDNEPVIAWYFINTEGAFCRVWNFILTLTLIYNMIVIPFMLVYPTVFQWCETQEEIKKPMDDKCTPDWNSVLKEIEVACDIIWVVEIVFNFFKWTKSDKTIIQIAYNYVTAFFIFDVVSVIPLFFG